jgi:fructose-1,6-bisphosphatase/inositol monophosphatase family enzyme
VATRCGEVIAARFARREARVQEKTNSADVVTETDRECEEIIRAEMRERYPTHRFIGEESFVEASAAGGDPYGLTDEPTWVVDPVDGTTNFVHGFPMICVSIALLIGRRVVVGVVYNPVLRETFSATLGGGAFLNGAERLRVSATGDMRHAVVLTEFGYDREPRSVDVTLDVLRRLLCEARVRGVRFLGSCAINMSYVAAGRVDVYYEGRDQKQGPKPWDSAAGSLIVTEAGGCVLDHGGGPFDLCSGRVLAANGAALGRQIVAAITAAREAAIKRA